MKELVSLLAGICLAAISFAPAALAQSHDIVRVHLSEAVTAAGTLIPAGDYEIREVQSATEETSSLVFHSNSFNAIVAATRTDVAPGSLNTKTELVLSRQGDRLLLEHILVSDRDYRYDIRVASHE